MNQMKRMIKQEREFVSKLRKRLGTEMLPDEINVTRFNDQVGTGGYRLKVVCDNWWNVEFIDGFVSELAKEMGMITRLEVTSQESWCNKIVRVFYKHPDSVVSKWRQAYRKDGEIEYRAYSTVKQLSNWKGELMTQKEINKHIESTYKK